MALNFPDSPSNGDTFVDAGINYEYNATKAKWTIALNPLASTSDTGPTNPSSGDLWFDTTDATLYIYYSASGTSQWVGVSGPAGAAGTDGTDGSSSNLSSIAEDILPDADSTRSLGSATKKWKDLYLSGSTINLGGIKLKDAGGSFKVETAAGEEVSLGGVKQYDSAGAFPTSGNKLGTMVMSKDKKGLYLWDSSEWDRISLGPQVGPRLVTTPASSLTLNADGSTATTFTLKAVDDAGFPVTYDWDAYSGSTLYDSNNLPDQITSVSRDSGVFSVIGSSDNAHAGSVGFRAKASDGVLFTPYVLTLSLSFNTISLLTGDATAGTVGSHKFWYSNHAATTRTSKYMNLSVLPGGTFYIGMIGAGGAAHGANDRSASGRPAFSNATITVPAGVTSLSVYTGGGGEQDDHTAGVGFAEGGAIGGGNSGLSSGSSGNYAAGAGGGGLVGLFKNAYTVTPSQADALMVVGSSGGADGFSAPGHLGGYGGKPGANGGNSHTSSQIGHGGFGGTQVAGGAFAPYGDTGGYRWSSAGYTRATAGSALQGGVGGQSMYDGGGGGGAGYFGGGGGVGGGGYSAGAGGGGSGYLASGQVVNNDTYNKNGIEYTGTPVTQLVAWADGLLGGATSISTTNHGAQVPTGVNGHAGWAIVIELVT